MLSRVIRAGTWIFLGVFFGRIFGLVRDLLLANRLGTSSLADSATVLITIPDTLLQLLVGGAMSAATIPRLQALDPILAKQLAIDIARILTVISIGITTIAILASGFVVDTFAPGLPDQTREVACNFVPFVLCTIPLGIATSLNTAWLQANDRFFVPSFGTLIYSSFVVFGLYLAESKVQTVQYLAVGIFAGACFRFLSQAFISPGPLNRRPIRSRALSIDRSLMTSYFQALACGGTIFLIPVIARAIASFGSVGSLALINYAYKLLELPNGLLFSIFAVAILPTLSRLFHEKRDTEKAEFYIRTSALLVLLTSMGATTLLAVNSQDIAYLLFRHGQMDQQSVAKIADLAQLWLLSLPFNSVSSISTVAFQAQQNTRTPMIIGMTGLVLFCLLAPILFIAMGLRGLVVSAVIISGIVFVLHLYWLHKLYKIQLYGHFVSIQAIRAIIVQFLMIAIGVVAIPTTRVLEVRMMGMVVVGFISLLFALLTIPHYRQYMLEFLAIQLRKRGT